MKKLFAAMLAVLVFAVPAAASANITALDPGDEPASGEAAAAALEVGAGEVTGASLPEYAFDEFEPAWRPLGVGDTSTAPGPGGLAGFPTSGASYAILSSGDVNEIATQLTNEEESTGENFDSQWPPVPSLDRGPEANDWTVLKVDVNVPATANCLAFDYRFLSEEFPEFVGSPFNDAFIAEIDGTSWRVEADGSLARSGDFAASPAGTAISVNGVGPTAVAPGEAVGTYFDAATGLVTTKTPITPGVHSVYLSIFDASDGIYDSAAFIDNLRFVNEDPSTCRPPTGAELSVPAPGAPGAPVPPSNEFSPGPKVKFNNGGTKVTLTVVVPGPGVLAAGSPSGATASRLAAAGESGASSSAKKPGKKAKKVKKPRKLIVPTQVRAAAAGPVKITVKLTGAAKKYLAKKRTLKVPVQLTFTPDGGTPATQVRTVTFKKPGKKCNKKAKAAKKCGKGKKK